MSLGLSQYKTYTPQNILIGDGPVYGFESRPIRQKKLRNLEATVSSLAAVILADTSNFLQSLGGCAPTRG